MSESDSHDDGISAEDSALFRNMVGPMATVRRNSRRAPARPLPSARPRMREADEAAVMAELLADAPPDPDIETGDDLVHRREGVQHAVIRRLRRGHYRCQAEIDLHGMVVEVARRCLTEFLQEALARGYRCVRIVHGKGLRSGHRGPVLKIKVAGWLRQREEVLAYASARPVDGGTGALYVLLRKA
ncbi:Smr/MutS family protein [Salinisphaera sp.]|uniref:Smr/MutS family protein n=1 Tax=Salinisphaera sp. TaxID=1914330 RepID=UPI002D772481|nr:Smr/MutS family protein [Salinisphaera sp.]HET7315008.1 Smr/MutS family protein [Salinisphaera sp.]